MDVFLEHILTKRRLHHRYAVILLLAALLCQVGVGSNVVQAQEPVQLFFTPAEATLPPDTAFTLMLDAHSYMIGFVRIELAFDHSKINLTDEITTTDALSPLIVTSMSEANSTGYVVIVLLVSPGDSFQTGLFDLAQVQFGALTTDPNQITTLSVIDEGVQIVDSQATELSFTSQSTTITLNPVSTSEREALEALYNSTDGPNWASNDGWLSAGDPCGWYGVTCNSGHVTELHLNSNQLNGEISPQLQNLIHLKVLSLGTNQLTGAVPSWLNNMASLEHIDLYQNQFSGTLPDLTNLNNLGFLSLGNNQLTGEIPPWLNNVTTLGYLWLGNNLFTGTIPDLSHLPELWCLSLSGNQLEGTIPSWLGNLTDLSVLLLNDNTLEGEIPGSIASLNNLDPAWTNLGYNMLTTSNPALLTFLATKDPDWNQTQTVPPTNVQATPVSSTAIKVSWTPINYTGDGGYYEVGHSTTSSGSYVPSCTTASKTASSCQVSGLLPNTTYYFAVRTYTPAHGWQQNDLLSWYSNEVSAKTGSMPLLAPSDLSATAISKTQIDLAWTDNADNADQFVIDRAPGGTENWAQLGTVGADVTAYSDTLAVCGSTYRYRVYATNAGGASDYSNVAEATTLACPVDIPTLLLPVDGTITDDSTPTFFWTAVSSGHGYRIQIDDNPDFGSPVEDALVYRTYHTPPALASGITYSWRVRVENSGSEVGEWSDVWTVTVDTTVLPAPILRTPKDGSRTPDTTPRFRWRSVKNAAQYRLQIADNWTFIMPVVDLPLTATASTLPDTDALAYGQYFWRVQALNSLGSGGTWSDPFTLTITILTSPKDGASTTNARPTFKWAKAQEATGYRLQVDDNPDFTTPEIDMPLTARKYRPDTPLPVENYFWRVQVITGTGNDTWMPAWTLTITPRPPARPKLLAPAKNAHTNSTTPPFNWWAVADGHTYQLQVDTDRRFRTPEVEVWVAGTAFTPGPLADGTYFWRVRAFNDVGVPGPWSAKWKVTVDTVPPTAPLLRKPDHEASLTAVRPTLRWRTVSDAASYEVQLDTDPLFPLTPIAVGKRTSYRPPTPLVPSSTYSWRVRAIDKAGNASVWSEVWVFHLVAGITTIETPEPTTAPPVLITPIPSQPAPPHKPADGAATPEPPVRRTPPPIRPPKPDEPPDGPPPRGRSDQ